MQHRRPLYLLCTCRPEHSISCLHPTCSPFRLAGVTMYPGCRAEISVRNASVHRGIQCVYAMASPGGRQLHRKSQTQFPKDLLANA